MDIENNFYMVDIPVLIEKKRTEQNLEKITLLNLMMASNNRTMEDKEYRSFIKPFLPKGSTADMNKFDRGKVEQLRSMQG
ncbi:hypothetical protein [Planomicrobium sp. MB-3u-38]|uniref:hypothetical protein n=1 Tax=Planomicrobium sp. MB-3u-38 TaxID=2058318 RepID=UPI000C7A1CED|nr:hypothetical protein [Planomicrobium sp. MB-3u-38]PKH09864.1 hypothetical protein CXF70_11675 [Planomicrobium sp. MB-3u-38]